MKRSGLVDRINKQIWPDEAGNAVQDAESNVSLGATTVFFIILCLGVILSVLILLVEICWNRLYGFNQRTTRVSSLKRQELQEMLEKVDG
jgi:hypothetical protein